MVGQVAFFLFAAGIQIGNTTVATYVVDCYPVHAMAVITFYSVLLNLSAFVNPFFIIPWITPVGATWTFTGQGIITLVVIPVTILFQMYGEAWRKRRGEPALSVQEP